MGLKDRVLADLAKAGTKTEVERDSFRLVAGRDGVVRQPCFFCNAEVEFKPADRTGDAAIVMIEVIGPHDRIHGVCHTTCAEKAKGSQAF
jgi:hypothetical protein